MSSRILRLIVEQNGKRRTFKAGVGKLSIGSGERAHLRLSGPLIAEDHAELELRADGATLRCRPGVQAPLIAGKPQRGELALRPGVTVLLGSARLTLEVEEREPEPPPPEPEPEPEPVAAREPAAPPVESAAVAAAPAAVRPRRRSGAATRRARREAEAEPDDDDERAPKQRKRNLLPLWIGLGAAVAAAVLYVPLSNLLTSRRPASADEARIAYDKAVEYGNLAQWSRVDETLASIRPEAIQSAGMQAAFDELRARAAAEGKRSAAEADNMLGGQYLQARLKNFAANYLEGQAQKPAARLFLERCRYFQQRWPNHPEMDWVRRNQERFQGLVDLSFPPSFDDVAFEVRILTYKANPPDYRKAFQSLNDYARSASAGEKEKVDALIATTRQERDAWYKDRLEQSRFEFERGQVAQAVDWLVQIAIWTGDETMQADAVARLFRFPDVDDRLRSYAQYQPDTFAELMRIPKLAEYARSKGIK